MKKISKVIVALVLVLIAFMPLILSSGLFGDNKVLITFRSTNYMMGKIYGAESDRYEKGIELIAYAHANPGYVFASWTDGDTSNPRRIKVEETKTYTAVFKEGNRYALQYVEVIPLTGGIMYHNLTDFWVEIPNNDYDYTVVEYNGADGVYQTYGDRYTLYAKYSLHNTFSFATSVSLDINFNLHVKENANASPASAFCNDTIIINESQLTESTNAYTEEVFQTYQLTFTVASKYQFQLKFVFNELYKDYN